jgi:predicted amino acid-binding ACT domain protein
VKDGISLVAAVGRKMTSRPGISGKLFKALGDNGVNIRTIAQGADELSIIVGVENADFEKAYNGSYRSQVKPQSLTASMFAWLARYNCQMLMCKEDTSGKVIHDILYREMKERLEQMPDE